MKKYASKKQLGITLIALVVTIIVLLILAGISIMMLTGQNGILVRAQEAKIRSEKAAVLEMLRLEVAEKMVDTEKDDITYIDYLKSKDIISDEVENETAKLDKVASIQVTKIAASSTGTNICYVIDVDVLVGNMTTGHGTYEEGDVYYLLEGELYYKPKEDEEVIDYVGLVYKEDSVASNKPKPNPGDLTPEETLTYTTNEDDEAEITGLDFNNVCDELPELTHDYQIADVVTNIDTLIIPSEIGGKKVTKVSLDEHKGISLGEWQGMGAVYGIKKIVFPETVKEIGASLPFPDVTEVEIPQTLEVIGKNAFRDYSSLKTIPIPESVTQIGEAAFSGCSSLQDMSLPRTISEIPASAFRRM